MLSVGIAEAHYKFGEGGQRNVEAFPFSEAEWAAVREAALPVVNAALADDAVLQASHLVGLMEVLAGLRARYGDHPVLLETEADFTEDDAESAALYGRRFPGCCLIRVCGRPPERSCSLARVRLARATSRTRRRGQSWWLSQNTPNLADYQVTQSPSIGAEQKP